ncbi:HNH endonuclease [Shewanella algidipiscicola]|uniref:Putative HNH nuclease YajD n=1 Tax=Shewanella algidipiscicola TaxID=614070 RepID=A0ABQ4NTT0_9GAMM|nr:HNH endonuclease signature motif containing protein [Shewanella algidipiscicola]GIU02454.1 hypothetical protein TUM4630_34110 [Shewanella algidipiscicola]
MERYFSVTFRIANSIRTKHYKTEQSAMRGIGKWLVKHQDECDINASFFSDTQGHLSFDAPFEASPLSDSVDFYKSKAWLKLRLEALERYGRRCVSCGASVQTGVVLHVDHIKPRSRYPELALDINNLQILCEACNLGKMASMEQDWR